MPTLPNINTDPLYRIWWTPARIAAGQAWLQLPQNGWTLAGGVWTPPQPNQGWLPSTGGVGAGVMEHALVWVLTGLTAYGDYALSNPNIADNSDPYKDYGLTQFLIPDSELQSSGPDRYREHHHMPELHAWLYHHPNYTDAQKATTVSNFNAYVLNYRDGTQLAYENGQYANNYWQGARAWELGWGIASYWENQTQAENFLSTFFQNVQPNGPWGPWPNLCWFYLGYSAPQGYDGSNAAPMEGAQYGSYQARYLLDYLDACVLAGRDVFTENPYYTQLPFALAHQQPVIPSFKRNVPGTDRYRWNWADCEINGSYSSAVAAGDVYHGDALIYAANKYDGTLAAQVARHLLARDGWFPASVHVTATDQGGGAGLTDLSSLPLDYAASGGAWIFARSGWGNGSIALMFEGLAFGGAGHNHASVGSVQVWRGDANGGEYVVRNTEGYSITVGGTHGIGQAWCHNTGLINGLGEAWANSGVVENRGIGTVLRMQSAPTFFFAACDETECYRSGNGNYDNPEVQQAVTEVMLFRPTDTPPVVIVMRRLTSVHSDTSKSNIWHFPYDPTSPDADTLWSVGQAQEVLLHTWTPHAAPVHTDENTGTYDDPAYPQFAEELVDSSGMNPANILTTIYPRAKGDTSNPVTGCQDTGMSLVLTIGGHTISIPKGASTGNWLVDGVPVASNPMTCTVNETGVSWS